MPDATEPRKIRGSIALLHKMVDGADMYALPAITGINVCAGKADGTSCGSGCKCISQQPYYSVEAIKKFGIQPDHKVK